MTFHSNPHGRLLCTPPPLRRPRLAFFPATPVLRFSVDNTISVCCAVVLSAQSAALYSSCSVERICRPAFPCCAAHCSCLHHVLRYDPPVLTLFPCFPRFAYLTHTHCSGCHMWHAPYLLQHTGTPLRRLPRGMHLQPTPTPSVPPNVCIQSPPPTAYLILARCEQHPCLETWHCRPFAPFPHPFHSFSMASGELL